MKLLALAGSIALTTATLPSAQEAELERPWTLMVYGAADNNADGPILEFLDGVRRALDDDPGMELVLFIDRSEGFSKDSRSLGADFTGARVYRLGKDTAELLDASEYFPGMGSDEEFEVDSADPKNIGRFVAFCKERFPARNYGLMIYSHADGCTMCPDEDSGRSMGIPELTDAVDASASVDFLALELCNMGGIEIAYQWRPGNGGFSADVLVAIPNAGPPLDWDRAFARIRSKGHAMSGDGMVSTGPPRDPAKLTPEAFGKLVIEEGYHGRKATAKRSMEAAGRVSHEAAACYDLRQAADVKRKIDALAVALAKEDTKEIFEELRGPGDSGTAINYAAGNFGSRPYVDLYDLCARAAACERLSEKVRAASREVCDAVGSFMVASFGMQAFEGFEQGKHGVFIVFPDGDAESGGLTPNARVWKDLGWYTPLEAEGDDYGRWAFLADGATPDDGQVDNWFELLDAWFDDTSDDPGGYNRYAW